MRYCASCKVHLEGDPVRCPLCGNLSQKAEGRSYQAFPVIAHAAPERNRLYRLLQAASVAAVVFSVATNIALGHEAWWSLFVLGGVVSGWACLLVFIRKRHIHLKLLTWLTVLGVIFSVLWDFGTGWRGWSVDFVIPGLLLCAMITTVVLIFGLHLPAEDTAIYLCILFLLDLIPLVCLVFHWCRHPVFAIASVAVGVAYLTAICILYPRRFLSQIFRRFHL